MQKKDFAEVLTDLRGGGAHFELTNAMHKLVATVQKTGRPGSITLAITVRPIGEGQVELTDRVTSKLPDPVKQPTFMFIDDDGNLTRECPKQGNLFELKTVTEPSGMKEVGNNGCE